MAGRFHWVRYEGRWFTWDRYLAYRGFDRNGNRLPAKEDNERKHDDVPVASGVDNSRVDCKA